ncbi:Hypothetical predicted protein [Cloeon dipterum]|uniref:Uncharacterized protein n=1 Tax=Cloeon dipterum TaxID=197152 RepID=A0A8S1D3U7_9INSE|nr:Hypothetical predicted protein [Cloeon dipterum]
MPEDSHHPISNATFQPFDTFIALFTHNQQLPTLLPSHSASQQRPRACHRVLRFHGSPSTVKRRQFNFANKNMHTASVTLVALSLLCAVTMTWSMALSPEQKEVLSNTLDVSTSPFNLHAVMAHWALKPNLLVPTL